MAPTDRQVLEMIERCISCMVFYVASGRDRGAKGVMAAEVRGFSGQVARWGPGDRGLMTRVEAGLVARYGLAGGRELFAEFRMAFDGATGVAMAPIAAPT